MSIRRTMEDDVAVLHVSGGLYGGDETDELERAIAAEGTAGTMKLVLDLSECSDINSTAFGVLVAANGSCSARGARMKLRGLQKRLSRLLEITGLNRWFES